MYYSLKTLKTSFVLKHILILSILMFVLKVYKLMLFLNSCLQIIKDSVVIDLF